MNNFQRCLCFRDMFGKIDKISCPIWYCTNMFITRVSVITISHKGKVRYAYKKSQTDRWFCGSGAYASVYKGFDANDLNRPTVAVKEFPKTSKKKRNSLPHTLSIPFAGLIHRRDGETFPTRSKKNSPHTLNTSIAEFHPALQPRRGNVQP